MIEVEALIKDSWKKDETFKMTIQYDNSALWTAVNLYGNILPFLVLYSMGLSILLPALGKTCWNIFIVTVIGFFSVIGVAKLEKSELSIRLAEKMDDMDRAWEWFTNRLIRIFIEKVRYLSGRVENEMVRFHLRMAYKFLYYLALLIPCWLLTRDNLTHSWFDHFGWRDIYMDVLIPEWRKHVYECLVLFLIILICL